MFVASVDIAFDHEIDPTRSKNLVDLVYESLCIIDSTERAPLMDEIE